MANMEVFVWTPALLDDLHRYWESLDEEKRTQGRTQSLQVIARKLHIPEPIVEKNLAELESGKSLN